MGNTNPAGRQVRDIANGEWKEYVTQPGQDEPETPPLEIFYTFDSNGEQCGVILVVTVGGPRIEIDTRRATVSASAMGYHIREAIPQEAVHAINAEYRW